MAVGLQSAIFSKPSNWTLALPTISRPGVPESMTSIMSYQYPLPPAPDVDVSSSLMNNYHLPALIPPNHSQPLRRGSFAKRGASGALRGGKMKPSASSPNLRGQARPEQSESALAEEKRRNKLGYHRTSIACGHCRRRKIRCIPAPGDPQKRCSNCIRLRKECHFHPVDQQSDPGSAYRRNSHAQGAIGRGSSSPASNVVQTSGMQSSLPYPHLSILPLQDIGGPQMKRQRTDSFSPENKAPMNSRPPEFSHPSVGWIATDPVPMSKAPSDISGWRVSTHESPLTPSYSPFTPNGQLPHHGTWSHSATEPTSREEIGWSIPQRSMSYSSHDSGNQHSTYSNYNHGPSNTNVRDEFVPRPQTQQSEVYTPSLTSRSGSVSTAEPSLSATSTESTPHNAAPSSLPPPFPQSQGWQPYPYKVPALPSNHEGFAGWYSPSSTVSSHPRSGSGMPPTSYGQVDSYGQMYYPNTTQGSAKCQ